MPLFASGSFFLMYKYSNICCQKVRFMIVKVQLTVTILHFIELIISKYSQIELILRL